MSSEPLREVDIEIGAPIGRVAGCNGSQRTVPAVEGDDHALNRDDADEEECQTEPTVPGKYRDGDDTRDKERPGEGVGPFDEPQMDGGCYGPS